jgi:hypothetical protein
VSSVDALRNTGYVEFPALYSSAFVERAKRALERHYQELGRPPLRGSGKSSVSQPHAILSGSGLMIGQLLAHAPELIEGYIDPQILAVVGEALGEGMRVETTAAAISDEHRNPVLTWHNHVGGLDEDSERRIDLETLDPTRVRRVTMLVYLDGLSDETGPLLVHPRELADPIDCPFPGDDYRVDWQGSVVVTGPPGTAVLLEERTWHASLARKTPGHRRFVGAMLAAAWAPPADNVDPTVSAYADRMLRGEAR